MAKKETQPKAKKLSKKQMENEKGGLRRRVLRADGSYAYEEVPDEDALV